MRPGAAEVLLAKDASNGQCWIVDGWKEDEVEPGSRFTCQIVEEASGADEKLQPQRNSRVRILRG